MAGLGYNNSNATFILDSVETAYLDYAKVSSTAYATNATWSAGSLGYFSSGNIVAVDGSATSTSVFRVMANSKTSSLDETLPTGTAAFVAGFHLGRTTQFTTDITASTSPGTLLYADSGGLFCLTGSGTKISSSPVVARVRYCDGTWLAYEWVLALQ